jgi:serine protease inhibitor
MNKAIRYRIYPTTEQATLFAKTFGCCRKVYNLMLSDKIESYKATGKFATVTPARYKKDYPYLKEVDSLALANKQMDLQAAVPVVKNSDFTKDAKSYFDADTFQDDIDSYDFVKNVNSYVGEKTKGDIVLFMQEPLSADAKLMLMNVVHMKTDWESPFDEGSTVQGKFADSNDAEIMNQVGHFEIASKNGIDAIRLPYNDDDLEMIILKSKDCDVKTKLDNISSTHLADIINGKSVKFEDKRVHLSVPKFNVNSDFGLTDSLIDLGVTDMFNNSMSSFPRIADNLYVSSVAQCCKFKCFEAGSEASAVTSMTMCTTSLEEDEPTDFIVDNPFLFVVRDKKSGEWLFMGYINKAF